MLDSEIMLEGCNVIQKQPTLLLDAVLGGTKIYEAFCDIG